MAVDIDDSLNLDQQESQWEVIAIRHQLYLLTDRAEYHVDLGRPSIAALGSDAGCYHDAIHGHPTAKEPCALTAEIAAVANFTGRVRASDGATSIRRELHYTRENVLPEVPHL